MKKKTKAAAEPRDAQISFKVRVSTKTALEQAADADQRSVSLLATVILEAWLKERGYLK